MKKNSLKELLVQYLENHVDEAGVLSQIEQMNVAEQQHDKAKTVFAVETREQIKEIVFGILKQDFNFLESEIDLDKPVNQWGFDSLSATSFMESLSKKCNMPVSPTILFEINSLNELIESSCGSTSSK